MSPAPMQREDDTMDDDRQPIGSGRLAQLMMQVLWPAFLMAIVAEGVIFSLIDPRELTIVGLYLADSREAAYTAGFFLLWGLFACSSGITYLLGHGTQAPPARR